MNTEKKKPDELSNFPDFLEKFSIEALLEMRSMFYQNITRVIMKKEQLLKDVPKHPVNNDTDNNTNTANTIKEKPKTLSYNEENNYINYPDDCFFTLGPVRFLCVQYLKDDIDSIEKIKAVVGKENVFFTETGKLYVRDRYKFIEVELTYFVTKFDERVFVSDSLCDIFEYVAFPHLVTNCLNHYITDSKGQPVK